MPEHKSKFTIEEYERRVRDILNQHRHSRDMQTDYDELLQVKIPGGNGSTPMNGEAPEGYQANA